MKLFLVINVSLPNLLEKCYTLGIESLSELEKFIYSMLEENITKLDKIMEELPMVKEYVKEAKEVIKESIFGEAYNHEQANNEQWYQDGMEQGIEQGKKEKTIDIIKSLFKNDVSLELISKSVNLSIEEIKNILEIS